MAKQRRASSRSGRSKPADASVASDSRPLERSHGTQSARDSAAVPIPPRAGRIEAVALYEEGVAALQAHEFSRASALLRSVLSRFPEERELHERVRLYINVCERHMTPRAASPSTPEERVFAATLAVNAGNYDEALEHLRAASSESPEHDHALYMLASVLALRDDVDAAVPLLLRAIELNPDNRTLARHDPDLEALREFDSVRTALEAISPAKTERRKVSRRR
jgi:tetratricopeptide (TPR) repeat protein